jgi:hypothetical protein
VISVIERPEVVEAARCYFTCINQVMGDDAIGVIESQLEESVAFFSGSHGRD